MLVVYFFSRQLGQFRSCNKFFFKRIQRVVPRKRTHGRHERPVRAHKSRSPQEISALVDFIMAHPDSAVDAPRGQAQRSGVSTNLIKMFHSDWQTYLTTINSYMGEHGRVILADFDERFDSKMVKGENGTRDPGRSRRASQKPALAETIGHGGRPQTAKSAAGAAAGPSGNQTTTHELFPSKMLKTGGKAGADAGSARAEGAARGTPGGGPQHTTPPAPGAVRRQPADEGPKSTTVQDGGPTTNTSSGSA